MKTFLTGFLGLSLYSGFLIFAFFNNTTNAGSSSGEIAMVKESSSSDSLTIPVGQYSEQYRPPVFIGIGPGGPVNHKIALTTGVIPKYDPSRIR